MSRIKKQIHSGMLVLALASVMVCGSVAMAQEATEKPASKPIPENIEKRLSAVERQLTELDDASKALRKQLDQLDTARDALRINATNLRAELSGAEPVKTSGTVKTSVKTGEPLDREEASPQRVGFIRFIFQFIFVSLIVGCVFIIVRIFISRWNEHEHEAMVEKETALGTVRHPVKMDGVPDKVEPAESAATGDAPKSSDEEKSIEFKNPTDDSAKSEKTSNKDYY